MAEPTQEQAGGSADPIPGGISAEVEGIIGAPIDTGSEVPLGVTEVASPATQTPAPAAPAPADMIPKARFDQVIAQKNQATQDLQNLQVENARTESDARAWRELNADPARTAEVSRILSGQPAPTPTPPQTSVRASDFEDDPAKALQNLMQEAKAQVRAETDPQIAQLNGRIAQQEQYLMGIYGQISESTANTQRAQLKEAFSDEYDPATHDALIGQKMTGNQNLTVLEAFMLVRGDPSLAGGKAPTVQPAGSEPHPSEVVEAPSGVPAAAIQNAQANMQRALASGSEAAIQAAMEQHAVASGEAQRFNNGG